MLFKLFHVGVRSFTLVFVDESDVSSGKVAEKFIAEETTAIAALDGVKMSQLPLFLAVWNILSVVESTTIDLCTDLGPVAQPERCGWCYGVTIVEDDYQFLASLRHNGGHLWRITTIYYGFSTSPTSHCTACAEYSSSPTQLSTYQTTTYSDGIGTGQGWI